MNRRVLLSALVTALLVAFSGAAAWAEPGKKADGKCADNRQAWVSPSWVYQPNVDTGYYLQSRSVFLSILNPGAASVDVTVVFHKQALVAGTMVVVESVECTKTIPAGVSEPAWVPHSCNLGGSLSSGSLSITADGPVLPSGHVLDSIMYYRPGNGTWQLDPATEVVKVIPMTFYTR